MDQKFRFSKIKLFKLFLLLLIAFVLLVTGFCIGRKYQLKFQIREVAITRQKLEAQVVELQEEIKAIVKNRPQLLSTDKAVYDRGELGIYSPLLEGKEVEIWNYKYKTKIIVRKKIVINEQSWAEFWEYTDPNSGYGIFSQIPADFAIFDGGTFSVKELEENSEESYTTNGVEMFYSYGYFTKAVSSVILNLYSSFFINFKNSKPTLVRIVYSNVPFPSVLSGDDPLLLSAKAEIKKIADTFVFGFPEQKIE